MNAKQLIAFQWPLAALTICKNFNCGIRDEARSGASSFLDGFEVVCRLCGHRVERPLPVLTDDEEAQNAWAVESATVVETTDTVEEDVDEESWESDTQDDAHHASVVDDDDINGIPSSWMADVNIDSLDAQDMHEPGDCLHEPVFHLFTARSPLRQGRKDTEALHTIFDSFSFLGIEEGQPAARKPSGSQSFMETYARA